MITLVVGILYDDDGGVGVALDVVGDVAVGFIGLDDGGRGVSVVVRGVVFAINDLDGKENESRYNYDDGNNACN